MLSKKLVQALLSGASKSTFSSSSRLSASSAEVSRILEEKILGQEATKINLEETGRVPSSFGTKDALQLRSTKRLVPGTEISSFYYDGLSKQMVVYRRKSRLLLHSSAHHATFLDNPIGQAGVIRHFSKEAPLREELLAKNPELLAKHLRINFLKEFFEYILAFFALIVVALFGFYLLVASKFDKVLTGLSALKSQLGNVERRMDQMERRFGHMEQRIDELTATIKAKEES